MSVIDAAQRFRAGVLNRTQDTSQALINAYGRMYSGLGDSIRVLEEQISTITEPSHAQVTQLAALQSLRNQAHDQINRFSIFADHTISNAVSAEIVNGLNDGLATVKAILSPQSVQAAWDMLPSEAVETMLGFTSNDSPLRHALVDRLGSVVAERMSNRLVDAISLGMNPHKTARLIREELGVGLDWALTTARTAQLWSYREATRAGYVANSNIVESWTWFATLGDTRTCMSCIAQHGSVHKVTEALNDHHNGRCVMLPNVKGAADLGISQPEIQVGADWFASQPESKQAEAMGNAMFAAWKAGDVSFDDLSQSYSDPVYGDMLREASLKGILGQNAKRYYKGRGANGNG